VRVQAGLVQSLTALEGQLTFGFVANRPNHWRPILSCHLGRSCRTAWLRVSPGAALGDSNPREQASEGHHKWLECAPLHNEPRRGLERAHPHHRAISTVTVPAAALALSPQLDLVAEQRHLYIEHPSEFESALAGIRVPSETVRLCSSLSGAAAKSRTFDEVRVCR